MKATLTDRLLKSLKAPTHGRLEVSDTKRRGLRYRLSASGKGVWMFEKRIKGGTKRKHTLGGWPAISLSAARAIALELEAEAGQGIDRVRLAEIRRRESEAALAGLTTVERVIEMYDELHLKPNLRTATKRKRQLQQSLETHLQKPISDLKKSDIQGAVDAKILEGRKVSANRIRSALVAFCNWAWKRSYLNENIGENISKAIKESPRERVLTIEENKAILATSRDMGGLWGPLVRLMILTAQRKSVISKLKWGEVDFEKSQILLSGARTKNGKPNITHLSKPALEELKFMKGRSGNSEYVFTTTGTTPVSGFSKVKKRLDGLLGEGFPHWRFHDFRTGFATNLAEAGASEAVIDRVLNHVAVGSAPSVVSRIYNQSEQLEQRAVALDDWAKMITE